MGNTNRAGLPYPEGTDYLIQGDDAMRALAERLDGSISGPVSVPFAIAAGKVLCDFANAPSSDVVVTFPVGRFTVAPMVYATCTAGTLNYIANAYGATPAQCHVVAFHKAGTSTSTQDVAVDWIAVQMTSAAGGDQDATYEADPNPEYKV